MTMHFIQYLFHRHQHCQFFVRQVASFARRAFARGTLGQLPMAVIARVHCRAAGRPDFRRKIVASIRGRDYRRPVRAIPKAPICLVRRNEKNAEHAGEFRHPSRGAARRRAACIPRKWSLTGIERHSRVFSCIGHSAISAMRAASLAHPSAPIRLRHVAELF